MSRFENITKMLAWIITILIVSIAVIAGVFVVHVSKIPEADKSKILTIVGLLIFISLTVSTFKQQRIFNFSLLNSRYRNQIQQVYTSADMERHIGQRMHKQKFDILKRIDNKDYYKQNYEGFPYSNQDYQEKILFKSRKYEGCSFFLKDLAQTFRSYNIPTLYVYLSEPVFVDSLDTFANLFGLPDFMIMKQAFLSFRRKGVFSYILIDNPQYLFLNVGKKKGYFSVWKRHDQLSELEYFINQAQISVIMNVQRHFLSSFQSVFGHLMDIRQFQIKDWRIPSTSIAKQWINANKQGSLNYQFDQIQPNFMNLYRILKQNTPVSQHQTSVMIKNVKMSQAQQAGVEKVYQKIIKSNVNQLSIQQFKMLGASVHQLDKLQQLDLIRLQNGILHIRK